MMKVGPIIAAATFLLIAIAASVVAADNEVVRDIGGRPVKANTPYNAVFLPKIKPGSIPDPAKRSGWLSRIGIGARKSNELWSCPEIAIFFRVRQGPPEPHLRIIFVTSEDVVRVNTKLNIKFARPSFCEESGFWRAGSRRFGRVIHLDGSKSGDDSIFTIKKSNGDRYKIAFGAPSVDPHNNSTDIFMRGDSRITVLQVGRGEDANQVLELEFVELFNPS